MVRAILGVIIGYVVTALFIFVFFTLADLAMGADIVFKQGTYDLSLIWIIVSFVVNAIAAVIGGFVCAAISRSTRAAQVFAGIVLVLGILLAIPILRGTDRRVNIRRDAVSNVQAMRNARTPGWVALLNPVVGAVGILIGAGLKKTRD
jgi:phage-related holin